ncbi:phosphotransferase family protein [Actinospica robiniae]|uniref:phosphotransferase family protein n=1 Tax=Actinospica robiniae TaxID=304901 RepID=UPI0003F6F14B|nr:aminoglycoside phosphotransferase family protein [Actinospica robiniae]
MPDSLTKRRVDEATVAVLLREAFGPGAAIARCTELNDGFFNAAYRILLEDGRDVVLKISPGPAAALLGYERDIMRGEDVFFRAAAISGVPLPEVLYSGFERAAIDGDFLVLAALEGVTWDSVDADLDDAEKAALRTELGATAARLHTVTNPNGRFGYPAVRELSADSWPEAYTAMLGELLRDAERYNVALPLPADELRQLVADNTVHLAEIIEPVLVHFDLWTGNIFVSTPPDGTARRITGLIDGERMIWGDPLMEFVGMDVFGRADQDPDIRAGYLRAGGTIEAGQAAERRISLYHLYMQLLLLIEMTPRGYTDPGYLEWFATECPRRIFAAAQRLR